MRRMNAESDQSPPGTSALDLRSLVDSTEQELRRIVAEAMSAMRLTDSQLSVLRNTYPQWEIKRTRDLAGDMWWWTGLLRPHQEVTPEMLAAGMRPYAQESDPIALATTLAWHTHLFNRWQAHTTPPP